MDTADFGAGITPTYTSFNSTDSLTDLDDYLKEIDGVSGNYAITVIGTGHQIAPTGTSDPSFKLESGVKISLRGNGTLIKTSDAYMWDVQNGTKLILRGPTLDGSGKNGLLVITRGEGEFVMENGTLTGSSRSGPGGGVYNNGTFTMNGGTITGNDTDSAGGGVAVINGTFTMNGGSITNNTATTYGGGVYIANGTFNLNTPAGKASIFDNHSLGGSGSGAQVYKGSSGPFNVNGVSAGSYD
jgi:hypothetical protein